MGVRDGGSHVYYILDRVYLTNNDTVVCIIGGDGVLCVDKARGGASYIDYGPVCFPMEVLSL